MDPAREVPVTVCWLEVHADRELAPVDRLRRFQVLWNLEAFAATLSRYRLETENEQIRSLLRHGRAERGR
jgi:hypothetical protein